MLTAAATKKTGRYAPESELPSDRHPARPKRVVVLEAVKVWPGKGRACD